MNLSKLVTLMKAIDKDGFKRLREYIHSPYFKVPAASVNLFDYLAPLHPGFPVGKMTQKAIARAGKNLSTASKSARAGSELLKTVERFVALENWQKSELDMAWHQFNGLKELAIFSEFEFEYKKVLARIDKDPEQDIQIFFYRHQFTDLTSTGFEALLNRTSQNDLTPILKTLDEFYAIKHLRFMCEAISRKQVLGTFYDAAHMATVLKTLEPYTNERFPYPFLFVNVYLMMASETFESGKRYYDVIKHFASSVSYDTLPPSIIESMSYAINWCLYWFSKGYQATSSEYLWWIQLKIKYSLLLENGRMMPITFRNIVSQAVLADITADWMNRFIQQYSPHLPPEHHDTNLAFAKGLYFYRQKEYTKAIQSFLTAQAKEEVIFNAIIRRWQYMSTYELNRNETDLLLNQLQSFEKYILRNQDAFHNLKDVFVQFIQYSKKMLQVTGKEKRLRLKNTLEQESFFSGKPWILKQLEYKSLETSG